MSPENSQQQPAKLIKMPEWDAQGKAVEAESENSLVFAPGERVSVLRSNGDTDFIEWTVKESNNERTIVTKETPEGTLLKNVSTPELKELQRRLDEKPDRDLGGTAVDSLVKKPAEVGLSSPEVRQTLTPQELMDKLTEGMSEEDKSALMSYAYAREDKASAQKNGDGEASTSAGYDMGSAIKLMSALANDLKSRFADYYDRSQR